MGLREYHEKRDFSLTSEPRGKEAAREGRSYVIQKHAASRLHYDFRLELEGVLKSWAVPKGPSLDPKDKRLAMETEDHPVDYGGFEGIIPEGQYGGGTVLLWDRGTWTPVEDPHKGYRSGRLKFLLNGEKLRGVWTLVKTKGRDGRDRSWLLFKDKDEFAKPAARFSVVEKKPESVATGRTIEQIATAKDRVWSSNRAETAAAAEKPGRTSRARTSPAPAPKVDAAAIAGAKKGALPRFLAPQLPTLVDEPADGDDWLHELKFDGYRILCRVEKGDVTLLSRNGKDWTSKFARVVTAAKALSVERALIDGEVAVVAPDGTTSFNALQNALSEGAKEGLVYFVFDLPHLDGFDLTRVPLEKRKETLRSVVESNEVLRFSDHVIGNGEDVFEKACRLKLEGVVSKRRDAPYESGRSRAWLKVKCLREQEFVIAGFTDPEGARVGLGALLLGVHGKDGALEYAGKVGTGFTHEVARELRARLDALETKACPFADRPSGLARAHWVEPELVAQAAFTEWTPDGKLRHPSFRGLREDKPAREVVREEPKDVEEVVGEASAQPAKNPAPKRAAPKKTAKKKTAKNRTAPAKASSSETAVAGVELTHADRVLYPDLGLTKRDLALFYESIADRILPHLVGRPTTLVRCPEGLAKPCFYQKHTGWWAPPSLKRARIREKTKVGEYLIVEDLAGLVGLVQIGILEIHTWNSVLGTLEKPDRLVFDLDPDEALPWSRVVEAALLVKDKIEARGLASFVKTTGGKALHVVVPLVAKAGWDDCARFSHELCAEIESEKPSGYTSVMSKARRTGKVFLDYLRNVRGATSVAAYSTRAKPGAPVSVPLAWDELGAGTRPAFTVATLARRLARLRTDPWAGYDRARKPLPR
jgi:bifunctional non-homologous end joining protein LigD